MPGWVGSSGDQRPVVSAGQYGTALNQLVFTVDTATGEVQAKTQRAAAAEGGRPAGPANYPADPADRRRSSTTRWLRRPCWARCRWVRSAGPFNRGNLADGTTENRGVESTLGNLVAEVQRWATGVRRPASAQIAFMNPGGLRADMVGTGTGAFPRTLTSSRPPRSSRSRTLW